MKRIAILVMFSLLASLLSLAQKSDNPGKEIDSLFTGRGEVYFSFAINNYEEIHNLTRAISIDNVKGKEVFAYANKKEFINFLTLGYKYIVHQHPGTLIPASELLPPDLSSDNPATVWNFYPSYQQYLDYMSGFVNAHPGICRLDTVGTSIQGRLILSIRISDNVNITEPEPQFLYTSSIHGDETTGYVLMMHLIDYLLEGYGSDPRVTDIINNTVVVINPLANPDGTYHGGNGSVYGAVRYNANNIDLNRNYPDPKVGPHPDGNAWQPETVAWMEYAENNKFSLSMNFHGGEEVFNYPWDTWAKLTADDTWWRFIAREYVDTIHLYSPVNYMSDFDNGITNGYAWYEINGGRQDYMNYWHYCREATLEISDVKLLAASQLINHWNYNYRSLLNYIEQVRYGFSGIVTDTVTGEPLQAKVFIFGHDMDNSFVYSSMQTGFYTRPIAEGTYDATFSSPGYYSKSIKDINVTKWNTTSLNVQLRPLTFGVDEISTGVAHVYPNPTNGEFRIMLPEGINAQLEISIMNSMGDEILSQRVWCENGMISQRFIINQSGLFLVKISGHQYSSSIKVLVVR